MARTGTFTVAAIVLISTWAVVSAAPAPAPQITCPGCTCPAALSPAASAPSTTVLGDRVYNCNSPTATGYKLAQTYNSGTYAGKSLYCDPATALPSGRGLISIGASTNINCTTDSQCMTGYYCSSYLAPQNQPNTCVIAAPAACFTSCNPCPCFNSPAPAPAPRSTALPTLSGRKFA